MEENKPPFWKKSVKVLGKTIPVWIIASLISAGIGSAVLLSTYVSLTATVTVSQSITLSNCYYYDNGDWVAGTISGNSCTFNVSSVGGNWLDVRMQAANGALVDIPVNITSSNSTDYNVTTFDSYDGNGCAGSPFSNPVTILSGLTKDFCLRYIFLPNAVGNYTITFDINPS